jgi:hypothetical protein
VEFPPAVRIGEQACIELGLPSDSPAPALIAGIDIRCWPKPPPWGGLEGGGESRFQAIRGGLAGGGHGHFQATGGGLAGDGNSFLHPHSGGLAGGGNSHEWSASGGLAGGGDSHAWNASGGLAGGGSSTFHVLPGLRQSQFANATGASPRTISVTWSSTTIAGNLLVAYISVRTPSAPTITAPSGWVQAISKSNGLFTTQIWYKANAAAQTATGNFTVTDGAGTLYCAMRALEFAGCATSSPLDKTGSNSGTGTAMDSGLPGTLSQNSELRVCSFASNNPGWSGSTNGFHTITLQNVLSMLVGGVVWKSDVATTSYGDSPTAVASVAWCGVIATFKSANP